MAMDLSVIGYSAAASVAIHAPRVSPE